MAEGGAHAGSISGESDAEDGGLARADRSSQCRGMGGVSTTELLDTPALPWQPVEIAAIPPEDYPEELVQSSTINADEMNAASGLVMMKQQVQILQPKIQLGKLEQNPRQVELRPTTAVDVDHANASQAAIGNATASAAAHTPPSPLGFKIPKRCRTQLYRRSRKRTPVRSRRFECVVRSQGIC